ncbi:hypothetical protein [Leucobacter insecticola]|uniref:hypothetical protein n=1 Tax=Leucobacter insecticola TaxID=2714934 RepID=UPI003CC70AAA
MVLTGTYTVTQSDLGGDLVNVAAVTAEPPAGVTPASVTDASNAVAHVAEVATDHSPEDPAGDLALPTTGGSFNWRDALIACLLLGSAAAVFVFQRGVYLPRRSHERSIS